MRRQQRQERRPVSPPTTSAPASTAPVPVKGVPVPTLTKPLADQALAVIDLPTGWAVDNSTDIAATDATGCFGGQAEKRQSTMSLDVSFKRGSQLPTLDETVNFYGHSNAQSTYRTGIAKLDACKDISYVENGETIKGTVEALSFPPRGDESRGYKVVLTVQGVSLTVYVGVIRKSDEIALFAYADLGPADVAEFQRLVTVGVSKLA
jgi:hypothetical protein